MTRREDDVNKKLYQLTLNRLKEQGVDIDYSTLESICKAKWEFIAYVIRFGQMESYRDKYLGNFGVKKWRPATKEYKFLSLEEKAYYDNLPTALEKYTLLTERHDAYHEARKYDENKLWYPVIMTDKKGTETRFETLGEASKITKLDAYQIYISCAKGTFTKRKLKFRFDKTNGDQNQEGPTN